MIGEIIFMGKSRIMSMGGLLWGLLGLIVDCIIGGFWYVLSTRNRKGNIVTGGRGGRPWASVS